MRLLNVELMREPINWVTVPIMVAAVALALYILNPWQAPQ